MGKLWNEVKRDLIKRKEGILIGGVIGFGLSSFWLVNNPAILQAATSTQGIFENFVSNPGTIEVAKNKVVFIMTATFALIGYFIDGIVDKKR